MCPRFPIDFDTYRREAASLRQEARLAFFQQAARWITTQRVTERRARGPVGRGAARIRAIPHSAATTYPAGS